MTDTEVAAQANAIKAEANRIQEAYNTGTLTNQQLANDEARRHNEAVEALEAERNQITEEYNTKYIQLIESKQEFEQRLATVEQELNYANEATKRELEAESNTIQEKLATIQQQIADNDAWYNEQLASIKDREQYANQRYQELQTILGGIQNDTNFYKAQSEALYRQAEVHLAEIDQKRNEDQLYWNNVFRSMELGLKRDELNSLNTYRQQSIEQQAKDRTANIVTNVTGNIVSAVAGIFRGAAGLIVGKDTHESAKKAFDKLFN